MVMKLLKAKTPADPYLCQPIKTDRFSLVNCNRKEAIKITLPWRADPEILENLMMSQTSYSVTEWTKRMRNVNGHSQFYHAIVAKDIKGTIGTHRLTVNKHGTANLAIVLHARSWWGKGVFEEVRAAIMDHFSGSDRVVRFVGHVLSRNVSSVYNYNKLGFRLVGYERQVWQSPASGEHLDTLTYEMLAADWRAQRGLTHERPSDAK